MNPSLPPEFAAAGAWLWDIFGKEIVSGTYSSFKGQFQKQWEKIEWTLAAKRYREELYKRYSTMIMLGNPNPMPIRDIYTDIYILDHLTAFKRYNIEEIRLEKHDLQGGNRVNALEVVKKEQRLFILGKPGSGKTTLMRYVALSATKGDINKVPIFISLNAWAVGKSSLLDFIKKQFEMCKFPDAELFIVEVLLKKGRAIVLFDGLDEVNEENDKRREITRQISDFTNQYSENSFIITCRVATTDYIFERFSYVEVADFTNEQVKSFILNWFIHDSNSKDGFKKGNWCFDELNRPENERLRELGKTPILLNLLCLNYVETMSFPPIRAEIYQEGIDVLLKKWDASRDIKRDEIYKGLTYGRRHQLLSRLAAEYFEKGETLFKKDDLSNNISNILQTFPSSSSEEPPDGYSVLRSIEAQHGLLIERAQDIHSFLHLTFQEYFTARYIVDHVADGSLDKLMTHVTHKRWREVFLLTASLLSDTESFFTAFLKEKKEKLVLNEPAVLETLERVVLKTRKYGRANAFVACRYVFELNRDIVNIANKIRFIASSNDPVVAIRDYKNPDEPEDLNWLRDLEASSKVSFDTAQDKLSAPAMRQADMDWLSNLGALSGSQEDLSRLNNLGGNPSNNSQEEADDENVQDEGIELDDNYQIDLALRNIFVAVQELLIRRCMNDNNSVKNNETMSSEWRKLMAHAGKENSELLDELKKTILRLADAYSDQSIMKGFVTFANEYQSILMKNRDIGFDKKMNTTQKENIDRILRADALMFECLRLSVITNRKEIEGQLRWISNLRTSNLR